TSTLVFEGEGRVEEYVGGYVDWQRQRHAAVPAAAERSRQATEARAAGAQANASAPPTASGRKLSYNEQRELNLLPERIEALEAEQAALAERVAHPEFYMESADAIAGALDRVAAIERDLLDAYARWDALDSRS